jgi:hypothetical protein
MLKEDPSRADLAYGVYASAPGGPGGAWVVSAASRATFAVAGGPTLPVDQWTHVAVTHDGTTMRYFQNGVQVASAPAGGAIASSSGPLSIGGNAIWGEWFSGLIDEVRVHNRALTAAELAAAAAPAP